MATLLSSHLIHDVVMPRTCVQPITQLCQTPGGNIIMVNAYGQGNVLVAFLASLSNHCLLSADACRLHALGTCINAPMAQHCDFG